MRRFCYAFAFLFVVAVSAYLRADCDPSKDERNFKDKQAGAGVEVLGVDLAAATAVDSALLPKVATGLIGSCFPSKGTVEGAVYGQFSAAGYKYVHIEDLVIETINSATSPPTVQVKGTVTELIEAPKCATDAKGPYQFLMDHRSNSLEAEPECVDRAFAEMSFEAGYRNTRVYTKALVDLLDFEERDQEPEISHHFAPYPAMEILGSIPAAVPYLVDAIKQNESELVRKNAADSIFWIYRECTPAAVARLNHEAEKPEVSFEQRTRLQIAAEFVKNYFPGGPGLCKAENGDPSTGAEVERKISSGELQRERFGQSE